MLAYLLPGFRIIKVTLAVFGVHTRPWCDRNAPCDRIMNGLMGACHHPGSLCVGRVRAHMSSKRKPDIHVYVKAVKCPSTTMNVRSFIYILFVCKLCVLTEGFEVYMDIWLHILITGGFFSLMASFDISLSHSPPTWNNIYGSTHNLLHINM